MEWIVTDDIRRETWRRLFEFANIELTIEVIGARHGAPKNNSEKQNYKKQAQQVRVCVLQAKEYFDAAENSTLFTSPNHAYYGAISLASMMMLLVGDGTKSLDILRDDNANNHHGLDFSTACTAKTASNGLTLIENTRVEVLRRGHFANWYSTLPRQWMVHGIVSRIIGQSINRNFEVIGFYDIPVIDSLIGLKRTILDLFKYLPDLNSDLYRARVPAFRTRTTHQVEIHITPNATVTVNVWYIHGASSKAERDAVLEQFSVAAEFVDDMTFDTINDDSTGGVVRLRWTSGNPLPRFKWANSRDTMNHETISYADGVESPEIVDMYLAAYQLSMISRYFPDIWISCIESQCKAAKLIESVMELIKKKLPILALSAVTPGGVTISTHREPWKQ